MTNETRAPFRANHVGSLLRPQELMVARAKRDKGEINPAELREIEDRSIGDAVKMQEDVGMRGITDGEFRRTLWHADFLSQIEGIKVVEGLLPDSAKHFQNPDQDVQRSPTQFVVTGKLSHPRGIEVDNFKFLASLTKATPKQCIPSPSLVHFRTGRAGVDLEAYPEMDQFFADLARVYRQEIAELAAAGCTYLQIDDVNFAYLCDPKMREGARKIGEDPDKLPVLYANLINECIKERPASMSVCTHLCRGNFRSSWVAEGGYDPVAEVLFNALAVDGYFLEFDTPRAGNFAPLRYLPKGKKLILGLVTTKTPELEKPDVLKRRVDEASKFVPLDQLGISPQCGFASTVLGNKLTIGDEIAKLKLVVEVARDIWGDK
jgi:5-methyltetrahydropteroyltriglutamate--homocysteine methyltransferase